MMLGHRQKNWYANVNLLLRFPEETARCATLPES